MTMILVKVDEVAASAAPIDAEPTEGAEALRLAVDPELVEGPAARSGQVR
jgi:hypothetical protein